MFGSGIDPINKSGTSEFTAVVLAGSRHSLFPLTENPELPKALLPIANRPMIYYIMKWLQDGGITDVVVVTSEQSQPYIDKYLQEEYKGLSNIKIESRSESMGTAEVIGSVYEHIKGDAIVMTCDTINDTPTRQFLDIFRLNRPSVAAVFSEAMPSEGGGGSSKDDETKYITAIDQMSSRLIMLKPIEDDSVSFGMRSSIYKTYPSLALSNNFQDAHIYVLSRWVIEFIRANPDITSLKDQLLPILVRAQTQPQIYEKYNLDAYIKPKTEATGDENQADKQDDSQPENQEDATDSDEKNTLSVLAYTRRNCIGIRANTIPRYCDINKVLVKFKQGPNVDRKVLANPKITVTPDSLVGNSNEIGEKTRIEKSVIGSHCKIGNNVKIVNSVIMGHATIEDGVSLDSCVVCPNSQIGANSTISKSEIGEKTKVQAETYVSGEQLIVSSSPEDAEGITVAFG